MPKKGVAKNSASLRHAKKKQAPKITEEKSLWPSFRQIKTYFARGKDYDVLRGKNAYKVRGLASLYSHSLHNKPTSSGEKYNMHAMTAAHRSLPLHSYLKVKNLGNGREVIVKINDRGPFHRKRVIDLSAAAAKQLKIQGMGLVEIEAVSIYPKAKSLIR